MKFCLYLFLLSLVIGQATAQTAGLNGYPNSCSADFSAAPDPGNPMLIRFQDLSTGQITLWQWNFGDGTTATVQNPEHTYANGGTYFVCLTVSDNDSGFICHDVKCIAITVHVPGACIADYHFDADPADQQKIHFYDESTGNIDSWHWDFGDGSTSDYQHPTHTFATSGKYRVCLTAYDADSVSTCNDTKCDSVQVFPPAVCHAQFTSELDTLNTLPNTYRFVSTSTGDPNKFWWKFDDGGTYSAPSFMHQFKTSGPHQVCLTVKKEIGGQVACIDSTCATVVSPRYFDIGGHLFAGSYPINNPVSTSDTGMVYLYRIDGTRLTPFDTCRFTSMGYFAFPKILGGNYIIRAALTPGSAHFPAWFPAYYRLASAWKAAILLNLADSNCYNADIYLAPANVSLTGPGSLSGTVERTYTKSNNAPLANAEVVLLDGQLNALTFAISDKSGKFAFDNLPYGGYSLFVEYPGKYSRVTAIWLDATTPTIDDLHLEVFNHDVTGLPGTGATGITAGDLFPNPATDAVNMALELPQPVTLEFSVITLAGSTVWSGTTRCNGGSCVVTVPVSLLGAGMYLFTVGTADGTRIAVKKLLRY